MSACICSRPVGNKGARKKQMLQKGEAESKQYWISWSETNICESNVLKGKRTQAEKYLKIHFITSGVIISIISVYDWGGGVPTTISIK